MTKKCVWHVNFFSFSISIYVSPIYWSFIFNLPSHLLHKDVFWHARGNLSNTIWCMYTFFFKKIKSIWLFKRISSVSVSFWDLKVVLHYRTTIHHRIRAFFAVMFLIINDLGFVAPIFDSLECLNQYQNESDKEKSCVCFHFESNSLITIDHCLLRNLTFPYWIITSFSKQSTSFSCLQRKTCVHHILQQLAHKWSFVVQ